jgi:hypothetical protein
MEKDILTAGSKARPMEKKRKRWFYCTWMKNK